jgi:O-methyltransferase involved in polyketide biosynthesis
LRIDPHPTVRWFDVDFPDTVALRQQLYPARPGYSLLGTSLTDLDWMDAIPADRPTLILAEGLTPYLDPKAGLALFQALGARFRQGELVIDIFSRLGCDLAMREGTISATGARLIWGIDDPSELTSKIPSLTFIEELASYRPEMNRLGWHTAPFFWLLLQFAVVRNMGRIVRFRQSQRPSDTLPSSGLAALDSETSRRQQSATVRQAPVHRSTL